MLSLGQFVRVILAVRGQSVVQVMVEVIVSVAAQKEEQTDLVICDQVSF